MRWFALGVADGAATCVAARRGGRAGAVAAAVRFLQVSEPHRVAVCAQGPVVSGIPLPSALMSGEAPFVQLKDIVARTLEAKGVLGTIRAQLRAAVFTVGLGLSWMVQIV